MSELEVGDQCWVVMLPMMDEFYTGIAGKTDADLVVLPGHVTENRSHCFVVQLEGNWEPGYVVKDEVFHTQGEAADYIQAQKNQKVLRAIEKSNE